jgi:phage gp36-like protein
MKKLSILALAIASAFLTQPLDASTSKPLPMYVELSDLKGKIPSKDLLAALDDDQDGNIDGDVWAQIQLDVQTEIDGVLGQRYATPFMSPIPAVVTLAAKRFAIEAVYARRNLVDEKLPYVVDANASRKTLAAIAAGTQPLWPDQHRKNPVGGAITEKSRTNSDRPNI